MRRSLLVAACLAALTLPAITPAAHADTSICGQPGDCAGAHCHAGDTFHILVTGPDYVQGTALCGQDRVFCEGFQECTNSGVASEESDLGCDLSQGTQAVCWADGDGTGLLDPLLCSQFTALAPTVNGLVDVVYIDPSDGDLYVGFSLVYDCPPYVN